MASDLPVAIQTSFACRYNPLSRLEGYSDAAAAVGASLASSNASPLETYVADAAGGAVTKRRAAAGALLGALFHELTLLSVLPADELVEGYKKLLERMQAAAA